MRSISAMTSAGPWWCAAGRVGQPSQDAVVPDEHAHRAHRPISATRSPNPPATTRPCHPAARSAKPGEVCRRSDRLAGRAHRLDSAPREAGQARYQATRDDLSSQNNHAVLQPGYSSSCRATRRCPGSRGGHSGDLLIRCDGPESAIPVALPTCSATIGRRAQHRQVHATVAHRVRVIQPGQEFGGAVPGVVVSPVCGHFIGRVICDTRLLEF